MQIQLEQIVSNTRGFPGCSEVSSWHFRHVFVNGCIYQVKQNILLSGTRVDDAGKSLHVCIAGLVCARYLVQACYHAQEDTASVA